MPTIDIGFSPCPNDTFIFDALVNQKIDTKGYTFNIHLEDVQTLNEWAIAGKLPYSKISYGVWPLLKNSYQLLNSGGALGKGVGPLLIYKDEQPAVETMQVAIPGINTTAHILFSLAFPEVLISSRTKTIGLSIVAICKASYPQSSVNDGYKFKSVLRIASSIV